VHLVKAAMLWVAVLLILVEVVPEFVVVS